jgi:hypothetical protein
MILDDLRVHAAGVKGFGGTSRSADVAILGTSGEKYASAGHGGKKQNRDDFNFGGHNQFVSSEKMKSFGAPASWTAVALHRFEAGGKPTESARGLAQSKTLRLAGSELQCPGAG